MTGLIIVIAILEAVFILALAARVYIVETKLDQMIDALNNHAAILNEHTENLHLAFDNDEMLNEKLEDLLVRTQWIDDIDKLGYEAEI